MSTWDRDLNISFRGWTLVAGLSAVVALAWIVFLGTRARGEPARCSPGFEPLGARCCPKGQGISAGQCVGSPEICPAPFVLVTEPIAGCVHPPAKIFLRGGSVTLGPTDWDSVDVVEKHRVVVNDFLIDQIEVTVHRHQECVHAGMCAQATSGANAEPGRPVTGISVKAAEDFCAFAAGRLPTPAEWIFAASGEEARRFSWGAHGLVCRRAAYGLVSGPCATEGIFPELSGVRQESATPDGVLDLTGNVAEWTHTPNGAASVSGGSFRAQSASELKVWSKRPGHMSDDVGFRCVYPSRTGGL